jgi:hypothetical protein
MSDGLLGDGVEPAGGASALAGELGGDEPAWQAMARQREGFEFFAAVIFGLDVTRLGAMYLKDETAAAWEAWQEAEGNETMPALGPERETLKELARLSIENLRLKQTTPNAEITGSPKASPG